MPQAPKNDKKLEKAVKYAAMASKIRSTVIEKLAPAIPYLLRFKLGDYGFIVDYIREEIEDSIMASGLYEVYIESAIELAKHLKKSAMQANQSNELQSKAEGAAAYTESAAQFTTDSFGFYLAETGTKFKWVKVKKAVSLFDASITSFGQIQEALQNKLLEFGGEYEEVWMDSNDYANMPQQEQSAVVRIYGPSWATGKAKKWLTKLPEKAMAMEFAGLAGEAGEAQASMEDKKTPYMLSTYYGNVFPHTVHQIDLATHEEGPWAGDPAEWAKIMSINGVPMSVGDSISLGLLALCLNPAAAGNSSNKMASGGDEVQPTRIYDLGALGYPSAKKPLEVSGELLLEALIVLEITLFINRIQTLKEDIGGDWDFPLDYAAKFFGKMIPKPGLGWGPNPESNWKSFFPWKNEDIVSLVEANAAMPEHIKLWENKVAQRDKLMYVPVIDLAPPALQNEVLHAAGVTFAGLEAFTETSSARSKSALMGNFPLEICSENIRKGLSEGFTIDNIVEDNKLTPADAERIVSKLAVTPEGAVIQSTTQIWHGGGHENPSDKYNGGALWFRRQRPTKINGEHNFFAGLSNDPYGGQFVLQFFVKRDDTKLWYQVDPETQERYDADGKLVGDTDGLMKLLYLFHNRGPNLQGYVNPHYWNEAMKLFFEELRREDSEYRKLLNFTLDDVNEFASRRGSYPLLRMGLRLCWWVPSGMSELPDKRVFKKAVKDYAFIQKEAVWETDNGVESALVEDATMALALYNQAGSMAELNLTNDQKYVKRMFEWYDYNAGPHGHEHMMGAYQEIREGGDLDLDAANARRKEMMDRILQDKAHSYVRFHKQKPVYRQWYEVTPPLTPFDMPKVEAKKQDLTGQQGETKFIKEQWFCLPICEVLSDDYVSVDQGWGVDDPPENLSWQISDVDMSWDKDTKRLSPWAPDSTVYQLILKMSKDPEFKILLEYIFPISSVIPEVATIYGMEFFRVVSDYMHVQKGYFDGLRGVSDSIMHAYAQEGNYNYSAETAVNNFIKDD